MGFVIGRFCQKGLWDLLKIPRVIRFAVGCFLPKKHKVTAIATAKMFKKGSYNVKKAETKSSSSESQPSSSVKSKTSNPEPSKSQTSTATLKKKKKASEMTLKQKAAITNTNNKEITRIPQKISPKNCYHKQKMGWKQNI